MYGVSLLLALFVRFMLVSENLDILGLSDVAHSPALQTPY